MEKSKLAELVKNYAEKNPIPYDVIDLVSRIMQDRIMSAGQKRLIGEIMSIHKSAQALGRLAKGKPKKFSKEELKKRTERLRKFSFTKKK